MGDGIRPDNILRGKAGESGRRRRLDSRVKSVSLCHLVRRGPHLGRKRVSGRRVYSSQTDPRTSSPLPTEGHHG